MTRMPMVSLDGTPAWWSSNVWTPDFAGLPEHHQPCGGRDYIGACREAFRRVRRDVWSEREMRLVAKWESYG